VDITIVSDEKDTVEILLRNPRGERKFELKKDLLSEFQLQLGDLVEIETQSSASSRIIIIKYFPKPMPGQVSR